MRKKKPNKVRVQFQRVGKRLQTIKKNIDALPEKVLEIVKDGQFIAQNTLLSAFTTPNFTQAKVPLTHMANCIIVQRVGKNKIRLIAKPTDSDTYWNMYFAEYGAGVDKDKRANRYNNFAEGRVNKKGYWFFKDYNGIVHYVNTSTRIKYMQAGVRYIRRELKQFTNSVDLKK